MTLARSKVLRREAVARGDKTYHIGRPCVRGHVESHYVSDGSCLKCSEITRSFKAAPVRRVFREIDESDDLTLAIEEVLRWIR